MKPTIDPKSLTLAQKELLINTIDDYSTYEIRFFPKENRVYRPSGEYVVSQISCPLDYFYIAFKEEELVFLYKLETYYNSIPYFGKDLKNYDFLFSIHSFCIENEMPFLCTYDNISIFLPSKGQVFIEFKDESQDSIMNKLKIIKENHFDPN